MKKIKDIFDSAISWIAADGAQHIAASILIVFAFGWVNPIWIAPMIALCVGLSKELYDRISGKGCASWHDVICDIVGILIGLLLVVLYRL